MPSIASIRRNSCSMVLSVASTIKPMAPRGAIPPSRVKGSRVRLLASPDCTRRNALSFMLGSFEFTNAWPNVTQGQIYCIISLHGGIDDSVDESGSGHPADGDGRLGRRSDAAGRRRLWPRASRFGVQH